MSTTTVKTSIPTGTWKADVVHSAVKFEVPYMGVATFSGAVTDFEATLAEVSFATTTARAEDGRVELEGEITIKGVTQPATLVGTVVGPVTDPYGNERYGLHLLTTID